MTAPFYINGWPTRDISLPDEVDDEVRDEEPYPFDFLDQKFDKKEE
jgi:hypothetical protein